MILTNLLLEGATTANKQVRLSLLCCVNRAASKHCVKGSPPLMEGTVLVGVSDRQIIFLSPLKISLRCAQCQRRACCLDDSRAYCIQMSAELRFSNGRTTDLSTFVHTCIRKKRLLKMRTRVLCVSKCRPLTCWLSIQRRQRHSWSLGSAQPLHVASGAHTPSELLIPPSLYMLVLVASQATENAVQRLSMSERCSCVVRGELQHRGFPAMASKPFFTPSLNWPQLHACAFTAYKR